MSDFAARPRRRNDRCRSLCEAFRRCAPGLSFSPCRRHRREFRSEIAAKAYPRRISPMRGKAQTTIVSLFAMHDRFVFSTLPFASEGIAKSTLGSWPPAMPPSTPRFESPATLALSPFDHRVHDRPLWCQQYSFIVIIIIIVIDRPIPIHTGILLMDCEYAHITRIPILAGILFVGCEYARIPRTSTTLPSVLPFAANQSAWPTPAFIRACPALLLPASTTGHITAPCSMMRATTHPPVATRAGGAPQFTPPLRLTAGHAARAGLRSGLAHQCPSVQRYHVHPPAELHHHGQQQRP